MEALALHTGAPTVHWEDNKNFISVIIVPEYEKYIVMLSDMCTRPCPGPIISRGTKWMTGFRFHITSDTEHDQLMRSHEFFLN